MMKVNSITRYIMTLLVMALSMAMTVEAQEQRMKEFQEVFSTYQSQYRGLMRSGQHQDAVAPLMTLVNLLDTTTIHQVTPIPEAAIRGQR